MQVIESAVEPLDQWEAIERELERLGAQHVEYGVKPDDYAPVGAALITTLREMLGEHFAEDTEEARTEFYPQVSLVMERGAAKA
jgi:nitric oxide dioxygenase